MLTTDHIHQIALMQVTGVGSVVAKNLISYCGSAQEVFNTPSNKLLKIPDIGKVTAQNIAENAKTALQIAEREANYLEKNKEFKAISYYDDEYPKRLKNCFDAPLVLFCNKNIDFETLHVIGIVGTRSSTDYGKQLCEELCAELVPYNPLIISGLAYGIDICAHKNALKYGLPTAAVVAHGIDKIYPSAHSGIAKKMGETGGGIITEFLTQTRPDRENFPQRNRILAGLCDALVVVEAAPKGGALITANLAVEYNREVFAYPGRVKDEFSEGCNNLIKNNKANIITTGSDIAWHLNWDLETKKSKNVKQNVLFADLQPDEQCIFDVLGSEAMHIDEICQKTGFSSSKASSTLLIMEFAGVIKAMPGKLFEKN